jgi:DNA polymerase-3 subunit alpha
MLQVLPQAISQGQKAQEDSASGQGSIFDLLTAAEPPAKQAGGAAGSGSNGVGGSDSNGSAGPAVYTGPPVAIPEEDFSREQLLALEKETLGIYLSSHPLRDLRPYIRSEADSMISDLAALPDGSVTRVIGMIANIKKITTKRSGETMAFVTVEGLEGTVEMLCFPAFYTENSGVLMEDRVVRIKARVDRKDESETKLIPLEIEEFVPRTGLEPICISLDGAQYPRSVLTDLKHILDRFPGGCPVEVHVSTPLGLRSLRMGEGYKVDPQTSLFAELKVLLGEACVRQ